MANRDTIFGLIPVNADGSPYTGRVERVYVPASDSTAIFIGDAVKSAGSADADGVPSVAQAAAGNPIRGVVVGMDPDRDDLTKQYRAASTEAYLYIVGDPDARFVVQADDTLSAVDVGWNADITVGSGNTMFGTSGMELDASSKLLATGQLRILAVAQEPDNSLGEAHCKFIVRINEHELRQAAGV